MAKHLLGWAVTAAVLTGCAPSRVAVTPDPSWVGRVGVEDMTRTVATMARIELGENESFQLPLAEEFTLPVYPESLLALRLSPQAVCLRVSVDEEGAVMSTAPIVQAPDCKGPDAVDSRFFEAAAAATSSWRFDPAFRCVFPKGEKPGDMGCLGGREVPQAVSLAYRFVFEQQDGRGSVRMMN